MIATEYEPSKAAAARKIWEQVGDGVPGVIDLREGDLRQTLPGNLPPLDFVLLDSMSLFPSPLHLLSLPSSSTTAHSLLCLFLYARSFVARVGLTPRPP